MGSNIQAGKELDSLVGKAIGLILGEHNGEPHWWLPVDSGGTDIGNGLRGIHASCLETASGRLWGPDFWDNSLPRFSTNWSAAMLAAERFGLFDCQSDYHCHMAFNRDHWDVAECVGGWEFDFHVAKAPTGPLAICRAILALKARNV